TRTRLASPRRNACLGSVTFRRGFHLRGALPRDARLPYRWLAPVADFSAVFSPFTPAASQSSCIGWGLPQVAPPLPLVEADTPPQGNCCRLPHRSIWSN